MEEMELKGSFQAGIVAHKLSFHPGCLYPIAECLGAKVTSTTDPTSCWYAAKEAAENGPGA